MKPFWMVYVQGGDSPQRKHDRVEDARNEAYRLAKKEEKAAYVLECIGGLVPMFAWEGARSDA